MRVVPAAKHTCAAISATEAPVPAASRTRASLSVSGDSPTEIASAATSGVEEALALCHRANGLGELLGRRGLGHETQHVGRERPLERLRAWVGRDDEDGGIGKLGSRVDAVKPRHLQIEDRHIDGVHRAPIDELAPRAGGANDLDVVFEPEQRGQGLCDERFVVRNGDLNHGTSFRP